MYNITNHKKDGRAINFFHKDENYKIWKLMSQNDNQRLIDPCYISFVTSSFQVKKSEHHCLLFKITFV